VKNVTTYFRSAFVVPPDTFVTNLTFRLVRDDGAVVYLNGREMYRENMPAGPVLFQTPAQNAVNNGDEQTFFATTLFSTNVLAGTNVVAVEVHQAAPDGADLGFDLQLDGGGYFIGVTAPLLGVARAGGQVQITWPASATGFQLQSTPALGVPWSNVAETPTTTNGLNVVAIGTTNTASFFRLHKP